VLEVARRPPHVRGHRGDRSRPSTAADQPPGLPHLGRRFPAQVVRAHELEDDAFHRGEPLPPRRILLELVTKRPGDASDDVLELDGPLGQLSGREAEESSCSGRCEAELHAVLPSLVVDERRSGGQPGEHPLERGPPGEPGTAEEQWLVERHDERQRARRHADVDARRRTGIPIADREGHVRTQRRPDGMRVVLAHPVRLGGGADRATSWPARCHWRGQR
jgi:hypothetical protein